MHGDAAEKGGRDRIGEEVDAANGPEPTVVIGQLKSLLYSWPGS